MKFGCMHVPYSAVTLMSLILGILAVLSAVQGTILLQQIEVVTQGLAPYTVEGVATYAHGGLGSVRHFLFRCTSTINNGDGLTWSRKTGGALTKTQTVATGGIDLDFGSNPSASDAGVYVCRDSNSDDFAELNITDRNPAACPTHSGVLHAVIGETVAIEFYASGIPRTQADNYTWYHDQVFINNGMFEKDKRRLVIPNTQESDGGEYRFRVLLKFGIIQLTAIATTQLIVAAPPQITQELSAVTMATEWSSVTLTCFVNTSLPLNVRWGRVGGALPPSQQSYTNEGVATLTIPQVRYSDIGEYYFNASYTNLATGTIHYATTSTQLSVIPTVRLRMNSAPLSQFLYQEIGSSFTIVCQGSGDLSWSGPYGINISLSGSLQFSPFSENSNGIYSCNSSLGASEFIMITNKNPSVYSSVTNLRVGINTIATLQVYVGGSDPVPSPDHIQWFKNGSSITIQTSQYYTLSVNNTQLTINASNISVAAGVYECRVTTIQGQASSFINITLPESPTVRTEPSNRTVLTGNSASFECLVNGTQPHTIQWLFGSSSSILPLGVSVLGSTLVISSTNKTHTGSYVCAVSDGLSVVMATAMLLVKYPPTAGIGYTTNLSQPLLTISFNIFTIPPAVICSSDGYPTPSLTWMFRDPLPDGVIQANIEPSDGLGHVQLQWLRELSYNDNGTYMCVAQNEVDTSTAILNMIITAKPKISSIYPAMANTLQVKTNSIFPTFLSQKNVVTLICIGHGLPSPNLEWQTTSGVKLNASFTTHSDGVVSAAITMNKLLSLVTAVQCVALSNKTRIDNQTVWIEEAADLMIQQIMEAPYTNANFVIRLLQNFSYIHCASLQTLQQEMNFILHHVVILSRISQVTNNIITIDTTSCSREVTGAVVFNGHIETQDFTISERVFRSLDEWRRTGPIVFVNNTWATLDQNCSLLAPDNTKQECIETMHSTTSSFLNSATFYVLVGLFVCLVLMIVFTIAGILIFFCRQRTRVGHKEISVAVPRIENNLDRTLEKQNVDHTHQSHDESKVVIYDEVLPVDSHQSINMKACSAYASCQMPAEQQPASDQIHTEECLAYVLRSVRSDNILMNECPAYASSQRPVVDQIPMEECPAYSLSPVGLN